jgi:PAS domain S-box-containing protein
MLVVDMNYKVSTWNKTAERLTGYKKREVLRRSINSLDVFLNSKELQDDIKNIQNGVKIPFSELILRSKTGEDIWINCHREWCKPDGCSFCRKRNNAG